MSLDRIVSSNSSTGCAKHYSTHGRTFGISSTLNHSREPANNNEQANKIAAMSQKTQRKTEKESEIAGTHMHTHSQ